MQTAIGQFRVNIVRVRDLGSLSRILDSQTTQALDFSDVLRSEFVLAVSALDYFIHEIVRLGMLDIYRGNRPRTPAFQRFQVSMSSIEDAISDSHSDTWLEQEIINRHSYQSFQTYENIAGAVRLISSAQLWSEVAGRVGLTTQELRETLGLIVSRRNRIAHEADMEPSDPGMPLPIDDHIVDEAVNFIEQIAEAIFATVTQEDT